MCELQHIQYSKLFVSQIRLGQAIKIGDGVLILKVKTLRTRKAGGYEKCSGELEKAKLRPEHSKVKVIKVNLFHSVLQLIQERLTNCSWDSLA